MRPIIFFGPKVMTTQNKRLFGILLAVCILLLIPLIAMRFTNEVKWGPFDFMVAAVLLFGAGLACEFVLRTVKSTQYRLAVVGAILLALFIVWAELAVGLIGTPLAGS
jgi:hypothetical protein